MKLKMAALTAAVALLAGALAAHHGDAGRYEETTVVMTGTVVELQWVDPHVMIVFDAAGDQGKQVRWQAELGGRALLARSGWSSATLKRGDRITITGRRVKSGAPYINLTERANVVLTDTGKELFRTPNYEGPPANK